ncbi:hypothetical protein ACQZM9_07085 [Streptomyces sp. P11-1]
MATPSGARTAVGPAVPNRDLVANGPYLTPFRAPAHGFASIR